MKQYSSVLSLRRQHRFAILWAIAILTVCFSTHQTATAQEAPSSDYVLPDTSLTATIQDGAPVISASKAGRLIWVVREGQLVSDGEKLANIDDREAQLALTAAALEHQIAVKQADNDVDILYAKAQEKVTEAELAEAEDARARVEKSISDNEYRRRKFNHKRSQLAVDQAIRDRAIAGMTAKVKAESMKAAQADIDDREVKSPLSGMAVEVYRQQGEWCNPGDPILKLIQLDRLQVEGYANNSAWRPFEVQGKPVTVEITIKQGQVRRFEGRITYVSGEIKAG
ncbi:MAG: HlyD family efflux transporter periplasmic adaptor subunit, partial [Planctomycetales bacterium]|nr:HlyD family efflux transporter periplasmic adaptor subunit [Planctomycetales bacterium]